MYPQNYSIIGYRKDYFISNCDIKVQKIISKILDNTIHISFEIFMIYLIKNFKEIIKLNIENLYIYITEDFIEKSNYWIYQLLDYYKSIIGYSGNLIIISSLNNLKLKDNDNILIVDDCIYSGEQIKLIVEEMNNNRNLSLNIYLFVSFMTHKGLEKITNEFNNNSYLDNCKLKLMDNIYYIDKSINNYLSDNEIKIIESYYSIEMNNRYLIYFDHKMPDYYSTIPLIYSGIIASDKNKKILLEIKRNKQKNLGNKNKDLINKLDYLQFIKNTFDIRNINVLEPSIIKSPYKNIK